jgi:PAS domain S-box-containing protein
MGLHTATRLNRWVKSAEAKTLHAGRLNIGPRLILGFVFIILSMLAADAVILWQFHVVRTQAGRLNDIDQKLVAVLRVHTSMSAFHDRLDELADAEDADRLVIEAGPLRTAVLEDIRRATSALSLPPFDSRRDPTILPTLHVIQSALTSELEAITTLAASGDWRAVHLRLANQVRPLESLTSALVEKVDQEAGEQQAQTVLNIRRVQRLVFWIVPLTAVFTLLIAATLGLAITRSITQPLARLVEGSKALARGEFQHQVSVSGKDELAHLGQVFNDTARRLRDLYATLQSSEDRLRLVIDTIPAHAWSARTDGSVDFINQRFLEFTGRSMEDMLGWGWGSLVHPDDLTRYVGDWQAAVVTGEPMESEARVRRLDGDYRWLLIRNVPLRDKPGNIVNWYGTAIDIEERHRAEDALRRSEAYLAEAQRLSNTGSFGWSVSSGEILWSEETFRIFQYDRTTKPTVELILQRVHPEDAALVKQTIERASQDGKNFEHEYRLVMPDNSLKYVHVVAHALSDKSGRIEFVGAVMDVTERKRAEEALREAQANLARVSRVTTMGELTASLAHEIKQPITAAVTDAKTCLRWIGRDQPDVEEAREAAARIIKDVTRASDIISRISLLFKKGPPQRESLDVNEVIQEMIVLLRSEASRYSISIRGELANDLPNIMVDRVQLQQVFMNLMLNGIEAMKDMGTGGELTIKSQQDDNRQLLISVGDTGVGLEPEQAEQIFNAFFTTKPQGTGMGLPISRSIIESHGGRLWATSNSGPGATFQFTLPSEVTARQAAYPSDCTPQKHHPAGLT